MKRTIYHHLLIFSLMALATVALAELPREIVRLEKLDKIVESDKDHSARDFHVLVIFKACCTPNEQAINWASELHKKQHENISLIGLNVDKPRQISKVKNWLYTRNVDFTVYSDASG